MEDDKPRTAAIYARISSDQEGTGLGVIRQLEDCRRLTQQLGWPVEDEYVDNDASAYSGKRRPEWERLLTDLAERRVDAVVIYDVSRLTRRPVDLERFLEVCTAAKARIRFVASGDVDLGTGDGLVTVRLLAILAAHESDTKSRRVRRKNEQDAAAGLPHGGYLRAFGYQGDRVTVREDEASVIREMADRFLAGESLRSLATWLNGQGIATVAGGDWRTGVVRAVLTSGRIAGLREHRGKVVSKAVWPAIIPIEERDRILAGLAARPPRRRRTPQRYLLSGLLRCGRCGNTLFSSSREHTRRYVCLSGPDHGGCGHLTVVAEPLEKFITHSVLYRLDTPELADAMSSRAARDEQAQAVTNELAGLRFRRGDLAELWSAGRIDREEWLVARDDLSERIHKAEAALHRTTETDALKGAIGNGKQLEVSWDAVSLSRRHAVIGAVLQHAEIAPGTAGARSLDPDRVRPVWRI